MGQDVVEIPKLFFIVFICNAHRYAQNCHHEIWGKFSAHDNEFVELSIKKYYNSAESL